MKKYLITTFWLDPERYFEEKEKTEKANTMSGKPLPLCVPECKIMAGTKRAKREVMDLRQKGIQGYKTLILEKF